MFDKTETARGRQNIRRHFQGSFLDHHPCLRLNIGASVFSTTNQSSPPKLFHMEICKFLPEDRRGLIFGQRSPLVSCVNPVPTTGGKAGCVTATVLGPMIIIKKSQVEMDGLVVELIFFSFSGKASKSNC